MPKRYIQSIARIVIRRQRQRSRNRQDAIRFLRVHRGQGNSPWKWSVILTWGFCDALAMVLALSLPQSFAYPRVHRFDDLAAADDQISDTSKGGPAARNLGGQNYTLKTNRSLEHDLCD